MNNYKKRLLLSLVPLAFMAGCERSENATDTGGGAADVPLVLADFELLPRDLFFDNPSRVQGRISPDG